MGRLAKQELAGMPRFIDYALGSLDRCDDKFLRKFLPSTQVISIENVARFFLKSDKDFDLSDFPNCSPPFNNFLTECTFPILNGAKTLVGNLFLSVDCDDERTVAIVDNVFSADEPTRLKARDSLGKSRWFVLVRHGVVTVNDDVKWFGKTAFFVDENGSLLTCDNFVFLSTLSSDLYGESLFGILYPSLLAISFMHCKNVTAEQITPDAPVSKIYQKKHGRPLEKYHILNIEPMKKVLRTEGNSEKTGLKQSLHICRGHFKDFSQGKGLFGRFKGLYWWDSQVRGSHEQGIVDKDYNVKRPKKSEN